jgi:hypothetical protein
MDCTLKKCASENKGILAYTLDVNRYYNYSPCRMEQGVVAGNDVSVYDGNLVDLDSDLKGITRKVTKCPLGQYKPGTIVQGKDTVKCNSLTECSKLKNERLTHLPTCNIIKYAPKQSSTGYEIAAGTPCAVKIPSTNSVKPYSGNASYSLF